jgi:hypothetical protein
MPLTQAHKHAHKQAQEDTKRQRYSHTTLHNTAQQIFSCLCKPPAHHDRHHSLLSQPLSCTLYHCTLAQGTSHWVVQPACQCNECKAGLDSDKRLAMRIAVAGSYCKSFLSKAYRPRVVDRTQFTALSGSTISATCLDSNESLLRRATGLACL